MLRDWSKTLAGVAFAAALAVAPALVPGVARAQDHGTAPEIPDANFSFSGPLGTFDRAELQRGAQIYLQVCANCHSMHLLSYRNLRDIGLSAQQVEAIAASVQVPGAPNDEGVVADRPGRPTDRFRSPFPNEAAARTANGGALPPDLSVLVKAREEGADYVHALLTGYRDPPAGVHVPEGMHYNEFYPGHMIAMPKPLNDGQLSFPGQDNPSLDQLSRDVTAFLTWAAEPNLEARHSMGVRIVIFLLVLWGLAFMLKRKLWADLH
ncbi:cytochrome c1 [Roseomonas sp. BN140053]|uniref:cytochrome c1 n=1 Tax=Roseomonas sp. BN140053 TaxID=3391898 RepID=UPI0039E8F127